MSDTKRYLEDEIERVIKESGVDKEYGWEICGLKLKAIWRNLRDSLAHGRNLNE